MLLDKKIIAFDLDGTLTVSKSPITTEMANLIKKLTTQKIVVIISGGSFHQFETQFLPLFLNDINLVDSLKNLILLPTSGSQRYEYDLERKVWRCTDSVNMTPVIKGKVINILNDVIVSGLYDIPPNPKGNIIEDRGTQISFSALGQLAPITEKELWDPEHKKRQKIKIALEPLMPEVGIVIGGTTTLDFLPAGFNKATGLNRLLLKLNLDKSDMVFIGDALFPGGNDYSVQEAGIETLSVKGPEETVQIIKKWLGLEVI